MKSKWSHACLYAVPFSVKHLIFVLGPKLAVMLPNDEDVSRASKTEKNKPQRAKFSHLLTAVCVLVWCFCFESGPLD